MDFVGNYLLQITVHSTVITENFHFNFIYIGNEKYFSKNSDQVQVRKYYVSPLIQHHLKKCKQPYFMFNYFLISTLVEKVECKSGFLEH